MSASLKKGERRGVACRNDRVKRGQNRADEIFQEVRIDFGSPVMAQTWSIAKPGPVSRDRLVVRTESPLKWAHFTPDRNRAERAGNNKTSGPCPLQSAASSIDMPSCCHVSSSVCIDCKFLSPPNS